MSLCALTCELPLDPVTAEDGQVSERSAIEEWLKKHEKSPITNEEMGTKTLSRASVKNMIKSSCAMARLRGDKAEAWQKRVKVEERAKRAAPRSRRRKYGRDAAVGKGLS